MRLENRVKKLEQMAGTKSMPIAIFVEVFGPNNTPCNEEQARILKEGEEAEARGENISWTYIWRPNGARLPDQHA